MIYCMADIHGDYERYQKMLSEISFSDDDTLYIIGDVHALCSASEQTRCHCRFGFLPEHSRSK